MRTQSSRVTLPKKGITDKALRDEFNRATKDDWNNDNLKVLSLIFDYPPIVREIYQDVLGANLANESRYPGLMQLEKEAIQMMTGFFGAPEGAGDIVTSGTEAELLAIRAAIKMHKTKKPNIVCPDTTHISMTIKGADLMGYGVKIVPVDQETWMVDPKLMEEAIDDNTVALVATGGSPEGTFDPIPELARIARDHELNFHVDAAWGGFQAPFFRELGVTGIPNFDFRVDGVTTLCADPWKGIYTPLPAGGIFYRNEAVREKSFFTMPFLGLVIRQPGLVGSRGAGGAIAAWATLMHYGHEGLLKRAKTVLDSMRKIEQAVRETPGMSLVAESKCCFVPIQFEGGNLNKVVQSMERRGWLITDVLKDPACIRIIIYPEHAPIVDELIRDLKACVKENVRS